MIGFIKGKAIKAGAQAITIITEGGVGYRVAVTPDNAQLIEDGGDVSLWTYLAVRENALDLYGFAEEEDRAMFEILLTVSGIGPKSAMAVMSTATRAQIEKSVAEQNAGYLSKMAGVGKKMAEKIVLELKGKLVASADDTPNAHHETDALEALISLGYREREAREVLKEMDSEGTVEDKVREALKRIGKKR